MEELLIQFLIWLVIIMIISLPLHLGVKLLNGRTYLLKTIIVQFVVGIIVNIIWIIFPFGIIFAFLALIWMYREFFRLKWFKAFLLVFIQFILFILLAFILSIFGFELLGSLSL